MVRISCFGVTLVAILLLAGCGDELVITSPKNGSMVPTLATVEGEVTRAGVDVVLVNGVEVQVLDGKFRTRVPLAPGRARIEAVAGDLSAEVRVDVDPAPPVIEIHSPEPNAYIWNTGGEETIEIAGRVTEDHLVEFTLNDEPVSVRHNGDFRERVTVPQGAHRLQLRAVDKAGQETFAHVSALVGQFGDPTLPIADAVMLHVGPTGFQKLSRRVQESLEAQDLGRTLRNNNPAADEWWGTVDLENETHESMAIKMIPAGGAVKLEVDLRELLLDIEVDVIGFSPRTGHIYSPRVKMEADVSIRPRLGVFDVSIRPKELLFQDFSFDLEDVPGFLEHTDAIRQAVQTQFEEGTIDAIRTSLAAYVETLFSQIQTDFSFAPAGNPIHMSLVPQIVYNLPDGMLVGTQGTIRTLEPLEEWQYSVPGYLMTQRSVPPPDITAREAAVVAALDFMNAAVYAMWQGGSMRASFDLPDALRLLMTLDQSLPRSTAARIDVDATMSPVFETDEFGRAFIEVPDLVITIVALEASEREVAKFSMGAVARLVPKLEGEVLIPDVAEFTVSGEVLIRPDGFTKTGEELDRFMVPLVEYILPDLVDISSIPFPELYGFQLRSNNASVHSGYLVAESTMTDAPVAAEP